MKQRFLCVLLAAVLCLSVLSGCAAQKRTDKSAESGEPKTSTEKVPQAESTEPTHGINQPAASPLGFTNFDSSLIAFLCENGYAEENFAVSPLSFRAALALAASGAEGETLNQLLAVMGFSSVEQMNAWYADVLAGVDRFDDSFNSEFVPRGDAAYRVVNSVWSNESLPGEFRPDYVQAVRDRLRAEAASAPGEELADAVNKWVNDQTNGLIPRLVNDVSGSSAILVNALYLKAGWRAPFVSAGTNPFTTSAGETVEKDFMEITSSFSYYEDESCQLVSVPLEGGISMVFVLGESENLDQKLSRAEWTRVHVTVPKFDLSTSFDNSELKRFLLTLGCDRMFSDAAGFDPMFTEPFFVDDIVQKTKIKIYEEGLEAAAATGLIMKNGAAFNPEQPKEFLADRAFSFYLIQEGDAPELLFWGQIVK